MDKEKLVYILGGGWLFISLIIGNVLFMKMIDGDRSHTLQRSAAHYEKGVYHQRARSRHNSREADVKNDRTKEAEVCISTEKDVNCTYSGEGKAQAKVSVE